MAASQRYFQISSMVSFEVLSYIEDSIISLTFHNYQSCCSAMIEPKGTGAKVLVSLGKGSGLHGWPFSLIGTSRDISSIEIRLSHVNVKNKTMLDYSRCGFVDFMCFFGTADANVGSIS